KALFGSDSAHLVTPNDLHSDFRHRDVADSGSAPWAMSTSCGLLNSTPPPEAPCTGIDPDDPQSTCFRPRPGMAGRRPMAAFATEPMSMPQPSVFRLEGLLAQGIGDLASAGIGRETPVRESPAPGGHAGPRAFAYLVAANIVDQVWEEVHGQKLTIGN